MSSVKQDELLQAVRRQYGKVAQNSACGSTCCGAIDADKASQALGYSSEDTGAVPEGSNLGLGCGKPQGLARLNPGETLLDLGSGGGFDCFLAARQVGEAGQVIGVDMTPEMISRARANAEKSGCANVEFRLGEIENLPVGDNTVDVIISNCVINLSPNKPRVFSEAYRVLNPGGRLAISDIVATADMPDAVRQNLDLHTCCNAGATRLDELENFLKAAGFMQIKITCKDESRTFIRDWAPESDVADYVVSADIEAIKPAG